MSKKIQIDRDLFYTIFEYWIDYVDLLPKDDPRFKIIQKGLADKYTADYNRQEYSRKIQNQQKNYD